jgi:hypothetical protein
MKNYTIKTVPNSTPQLELKIDINFSTVTPIVDEDEREEIQIDNFLKYSEARNLSFDSWEEFVINDEINYYYNHQWKIQQAAMEKIEDIRQQCDCHAQALIKTLPNQIVETMLDTQQLNYDRIIAAQIEAEQQCREWIVTATKEIKSQSEHIAKGYENYIKGQLQLAIQECEAKIHKHQVKLQALTGEVELPPFTTAQSPAAPSQQPGSANPAQPASGTSNSATPSNQWKTPKSWSKNQKAA